MIKWWLVRYPESIFFICFLVLIPGLYPTHLFRQSHKSPPRGIFAPAWPRENPQTPGKNTTGSKHYEVFHIPLAFRNRQKIWTLERMRSYFPKPAGTFRKYVKNKKNLKKSPFKPFLRFLTLLECVDTEIFQFHYIELNKNRFVEILYLRRFRHAAFALNWLIRI
jgi:hypothetical protein